MNAYFVEFADVPDDRVRRHHHPGAEFLYVLGGVLRVTINEAESKLSRRRFDVLRLVGAALLSARRPACLHGASS